MSTSRKKRKNLFLTVHTIVTYEDYDNNLYFFMPEDSEQKKFIPNVVIKINSTEEAASEAAPEAALKALEDTSLSQYAEQKPSGRKYPYTPILKSNVNDNRFYHVHLGKLAMPEDIEFIAATDLNLNTDTKDDIKQNLKAINVEHQQICHMYRVHHTEYDDDAAKLAADMNKNRVWGNSGHIKGMKASDDNIVLEVSSGNHYSLNFIEHMKSKINNLKTYKQDGKNNNIIVFPMTKITEFKSALLENFEAKKLVQDYIDNRKKGGRYHWFTEVTCHFFASQNRTFAKTTKLNAAEQLKNAIITGATKEELNKLDAVPALKSGDLAAVYKRVKPMIVVKPSPSIKPTIQ